MRKIEQNMLKAIADQRGWQQDNTRVICSVFEHEGADIYRISVILHGSTIAIITRDQLEVSPCGWCTPTTKSRLNALLQTYCDAGIYQKNKVWRVCLPDGEHEMHPHSVFFIDRIDKPLSSIAA